MFTHKAKKSKKAFRKPKTVEDIGSNVIWAALTILSLPIVALSLSQMGFHPVTAFGLAAVFTFFIILIEGLVRGTVWFLNERFMQILGHKETAFRILVLAGGVLLLIQSFLLIEMIRNPNMDSVLFNMIAQKQCSGQQDGALADLICPLLKTVTPKQLESLPLLYSLEQAAKSHLMPQSLFGSCTVWPIEISNESLNRYRANYVAYCVPWTRPDDSQATVEPIIKIIRGDFVVSPDGFYQPITWMEDVKSQAYQELLKDTELLNQMNDRVIRRHQSLIRSYAE